MSVIHPGDTVIQDPDAELLWEMDWSDWLPPNEYISAHDWSFVGSDSTLTQLLCHAERLIAETGWVNADNSPIWGGFKAKKVSAGGYLSKNHWAGQIRPETNAP